MRHALPPILLLSLLAAPAHAQQRCNDAALDTFQSARRARRILLDHEQVSAAAGWEPRRAHATRQALGLEHPVWTFEAHAVGDGSLWGAPTPLCTRAGPQAVDIFNTRVGLSLSLMHERRRMGLQLFSTAGFDTLEIGPETRAPQRAEAVQRMTGLRLQPWRWTALTLAYIEDDPLLLSPKDIQDVNIDTALLGPTQNAPRYYLGAAIPALDLGLDLIISPRDEGLQTFLLNIEDLVIPQLMWLRPRASLARIVDEGRWVAMTGARLVWEDTSQTPQALRALTWSLLAEGSVEWPDAQWRHGRLRIEAERAVSEVEADELELLDLGAYLEATAYSSAWLARRTDADAALGAGLYGWARWSSRPWTLTLELGWSGNRPEALSQLSELRGAPETRAQLIVQYTR